MTSGNVVSVSAVELRNAFDFVSLGAPFEHSAYISLDSGEIYWDSNYAELGGESLPQDLDTSDLYLAVPHKNDLNLGHRLALAFVDQEMANDYATVRGFFRRGGLTAASRNSCRCAACYSGGTSSKNEQRRLPCAAGATSTVSNSGAREPLGPF